MNQVVIFSAALALVATAAGPALLGPGDLPALVDFTDMAGPGQSHTNDSGISGYYGNQGNDHAVGNGGGAPLPGPSERRRRLAGRSGMALAEQSRSAALTQPSRNWT